MPLLWMILTAFLVQIVTGLVFDVFIDLVVFGLFALWIKAPSVIPRWLRGRSSD